MTTPYTDKSISGFFDSMALTASHHEILLAFTPAIIFFAWHLLIPMRINGRLLSYTEKVSIPSPLVFMFLIFFIAFFTFASKIADEEYKIKDKLIDSYICAAFATLAMLLLLHIAHIRLEKLEKPQGPKLKWLRGLVFWWDKKVFRFQQERENALLQIEKAV